MALCFRDMQGLLIKSAGFTETVRFAELNFTELPNNVVSYQLAHKLLLYKHVEHALACSEYFVGKSKALFSSMPCWLPPMKCLRHQGVET